MKNEKTPWPLVVVAVAVVWLIVVIANPAFWLGLAP